MLRNLLDEYMARTQKHAARTERLLMEMLSMLKELFRNPYSGGVSKGRSAHGLRNSLGRNRNNRACPSHLQQTLQNICMVVHQVT